MEIGDQRIDRIGGGLHSEAAFDTEGAGLRQGEAEHAHDSDSEHDGDDGNGFQHEWLPRYGPRTKGEGRVRQGEAKILQRPKQALPTSPWRLDLGVLPGAAIGALGLAVPDQAIEMHTD